MSMALAQSQSIRCSVRKRSGRAVGAKEARRARFPFVGILICARTVAYSAMLKIAMLDCRIGSRDFVPSLSRRRNIAAFDPLSKLHLISRRVLRRADSTHVRFK